MANETFHKGDLRILKIKRDADYVPVGCLTSNSLTEEVDMLLTTTRQDNGWETARPTSQRASIEFEGVQILTIGDGGDDTKASYDWIKITKRARTLIDWKIEDEAGTFIDEGKGHITGVGEAATVGEFLTFSGSIKVYGEPVFSTQAGTYLFQDGETYLFQNGQPFLFN